MLITTRVVFSSTLQAASNANDRMRDVVKVTLAMRMNAHHNLSYILHRQQVDLSKTWMVSVGESWTICQTFPLINFHAIWYLMLSQLLGDHKM